MLYSLYSVRLVIFATNGRNQGIGTTAEREYVLTFFDRSALKDSERRDHAYGL